MSTANHGAPAHEHADHAHHFESANHQYSAAKQGIWLFMCTEVLMFGGLFVAYILFRNLYPQVFHEGASHLNRIAGAVNTAVLITSSLTMALSIHYVQVGEKSKASINLIITMVCALAFLVIKFFEYKVKIEHGLLPGAFFHAHDAETPNLALFFGMYFIMTGLHGVHVVAGFCLIFWQWLKLQRGELTPNYYTSLEGVGIFWHIVDLIWIYLFPLYYLVG